MDPRLYVFSQTSFTFFFFFGGGGEGQRSHLQEVSLIIPESRHFPLIQLFPLASQLIILEIMKCLLCKIAFPIHYSPLSILSTSTLTQAFVTFSLECCNNLLNPPASSLPHFNPFFTSLAKIFFLLYKHSHTPMLEFHQWLPHKH